MPPPQYTHTHIHSHTGCFSRKVCVHEYTNKEERADVNVFVAFLKRFWKLPLIKKILIKLFWLYSHIPIMTQMKWMIHQGTLFSLTFVILAGWSYFVSLRVWKCLCQQQSGSCRRLKNDQMSNLVMNSGNKIQPFPRFWKLNCSFFSSPAAGEPEERSPSALVNSPLVLFTVALVTLFTFHKMFEQTVPWWPKTCQEYK